MTVRSWWARLEPGAASECPPFGGSRPSGRSERLTSYDPGVGSPIEAVDWA